MSDRPDIGEQAISKTAEVAIDSQLDAVEELEVDIRTNPLDLARGKLENDNAELTEALLESTQEILDLRNFELDEMSLQVQRLDISQGKMIIAASALIEEFPDR